MGRFRDATHRKSSNNGSGVATAIPLDRHRYGAAVFQQLGDADKYIAAGEMTTDCFKMLARAQPEKDTDRVDDRSSNGKRLWHLPPGVKWLK